MKNISASSTFFFRFDLKYLILKKKKKKEKKKEKSVVRDEREAITPALSRFTELKLLQAAGVSGYKQLAPGVKWRKVSTNLRF